MPAPSSTEASPSSLFRPRQQRLLPLPRPSVGLHPIGRWTKIGCGMSITLPNMRLDSATLAESRSHLAERRTTHPPRGPGPAQVPKRWQGTGPTEGKTYPRSARAGIAPGGLCFPGRGPSPPKRAPRVVGWEPACRRTHGQAN
ncbi:hypothetical protein EJB05_38323 [Eragrostis curvula]|uniref:Uncharacterized protein n=1 Tax=Eragrostis curvula TaxID=38414 RepID=A0A5J9TTU4_9POAL|nr:hypothetical protein EJB05_38323 [Eragrostis curvula]